MFTDGYEPQLHQQAASISLARFLERGFTLRLTVGAIVDGEMHGEGERYEYVIPGAFAGIQVNKRFIDEDGAIPFLLGTFSFSFSWGRNRQTEPPRLMDSSGLGLDPQLAGNDAPLTDIVSLDFRVGAVVGYTFWEVWSPYLAVRAFGGPIFWEHDGEQVRGTDRYHAQAAIGSSIFFGDSGLALFVDWSPFLEKSFSAGAGWAF
ncbi:MAG: hypothetical protein JRF63_05505 [Deltaproteobacteria bacterium]|nr:hypothetical protein [Deltaproteobacteria bacterium]